TPERPPAYNRRAAEKWLDPYSWHEGEDSASEDVHLKAVDQALTLLDPTKTIAWIGDNTAFHAGIVRWRLYQLTRAKRFLQARVGGEVELDQDSTWNPWIREMLRDREQVAVLERPAGAKGSSIESVARSWLDGRSTFEVVARIPIDAGG